MLAGGVLTLGRLGSPDVKCIVHLHTPATVAVSCLKQGFRCLAQESAYFHKKVAYHTWEGISDDSSGATCTRRVLHTALRVRGLGHERLSHEREKSCVPGTDGWRPCAEGPRIEAAVKKQDGAVLPNALLMQVPC